MKRSGAVTPRTSRWWTITPIYAWVRIKSKISHVAPLGCTSSRLPHWRFVAFWGDAFRLGAPFVVSVRLSVASKLTASSDRMGVGSCLRCKGQRRHICRGYGCCRSRRVRASASCFDVCPHGVLLYMRVDMIAHHYAIFGRHASPPPLFITCYLCLHAVPRGDGAPV